MFVPHFQVCLTLDPPTIARLESPPSRSVHCEIPSLGQVHFLKKPEVWKKVCKKCKRQFPQKCKNSVQKVWIENQAKSKCTKSVHNVQKMSKSAQKVYKKCENNTKCIFIAESWGGPPPRLSKCTHFLLFSHFERNWQKLKEIQRNWEGLRELERHWEKLREIEKN